MPTKSYYSYLCLYAYHFGDAINDRISTGFNDKGIVCLRYNIETAG